MYEFKLPKYKIIRYEKGNVNKLGKLHIAHLYDTVRHTFQKTYDRIVNINPIGLKNEWEELTAHHQLSIHKDRRFYNLR
ncbi:hypothetical protein PghCCS26_46620 [Paenibacillus glycanilyticus]|uniref:Uncharacterized protein n=1 Tax=Paenibacillus glycanilyticus TaxID=126569 RepID=A0ABQ6NR03_9BACL|nr:hypothetical protein PghCCS26_46620 [Paenibacillus glycanilyticus]